MDYDEFVFSPNYPWKTRMFIIGLPTLFLLLLAISIGFIPQLKLIWLLTLLSGLSVAIYPFFVVRRLNFREKLVVKRFLLPDVYIGYKEIRDFSETAIHTDKVRIRLGNPLNGDEMLETFRRWKAVKILRENQNRKPDHTVFLPGRSLGGYALSWALVFSALLLFLIPDGIPFDTRWILGGMFLTLYLGMLILFPRI